MKKTELRHLTGEGFGSVEEFDCFVQSLLNQGWRLVEMKHGMWDTTTHATLIKETE